MWALIKKELRSYFTSPIAYIFIAIYMASMGITFANYLISSGSLYFEQVVATAGGISAYFLPVLTMRLFAEERKTGTEQLLLTSPLNSTQIVMGKFFAAMMLVGFVCAFSLIYFVLLLFYGTPKLNLVFYTYIGFFMLSAAYISIGMFISSITENQIIAGILSFAVVIANTILPTVVDKLEGYDFDTIFQYMTFGEFSLKGVTLFSTTAILFILLTIIVIQRRKCTR